VRGIERTILVASTWMLAPVTTGTALLSTWTLSVDTAGVAVEGADDVSHAAKVDRTNELIATAASFFIPILTARQIVAIATMLRLHLLVA
jgi:hypothetical protein